MAISTSKSAEPILAFASAAEWHAWLAANHARSPGVRLRIAKAAGRGKPEKVTEEAQSGKTGKPERPRGTRASTSATKAGFGYPEALGVALVWGWIDGHKWALDDHAWLQRFTPRRRQSRWSKINRAKAEALIAAGTMEAPGLAEVERARADGRWARAYGGARASAVPADLAAALAKDARAAAFFDALDGANRYAILYRVEEAKKAETRSARIVRFVALCARGETLHPARGGKAVGPRPRARR
jgi:uncharacterized protein YdeI (YjbR/CyaY-like superfamily)